jgi:hypothetical protein
LPVQPLSGGADAAKPRGGQENLVVSILLGTSIAAGNLASLQTDLVLNIRRLFVDETAV